MFVDFSEKRGIIPLVTEEKLGLLMGINFLATLVTVVALNVLALKGLLSITTVAGINVAIGGTFSLIGMGQLIKELKNKTKDYKEQATLAAITIVGALAIAASGLYFANFLPMKTAAGLALGGILFPMGASVLYFCCFPGQEKGTATGASSPPRRL